MFFELALVVLFGVLAVATADTGWGETFLGAIVGCLFVALLLPISATTRDDIYIYREKVISQKPIYSLETSSAVHGNFILGIVQFFNKTSISKKRNTVLVLYSFFYACMLLKTNKEQQKHGGST